MTLDQRSNQTGMQYGPGDADEMREISALTQPSSKGDASTANELRVPYFQAALSLGSMPPTRARAPDSVDATDERLLVLLDHLGERLAFERAGTRLYEAFLFKCTQRPDELGELSTDLVQHFCNEEAEHVGLLAAAIEALGGDPTVQTPSADVAGVQGSGLLKVVTDPGTTVLQSLSAMLAAELIDGCAWGLLMAMTRDLGYGELAGRFEKAVSQEEQHLLTIQRCYEGLAMAEGREGPAVSLTATAEHA